MESIVNRKTELAAQPVAANLWKHSSFMRLWSAHTVSQFGSQITVLALPLTAAVFLQASPLQMGLLTAAQTVPNLLFGLFAGVWVDRSPRRPLLIGADLVRFVLLLTVPILASLNGLQVEFLYGVAFLLGLATLLFDLAAQSLLPSLIERDLLLDGNAQLETSRSAATVVGPALAGGLVQIIGAPFALIANAFSFVVSAFFLAKLPTSQIKANPEHRQGVWREIGEGLTTVFRSPVLRASFRTSALWNLSINIVYSIFVLFVTRELHLDATILGLILACEGVGMLVATLVAGKLRRRFGAGPTLIGSGFVAASSGLFIVGAVWFAPVIMLALSQLIYGFGPMIFGINNITLRQAVTPPRLQGRINATFRFVAWGTMPLGAVMGGVLGSVLGLTAAIGIGAIGMIFSVALLLFSPLPALREPKLLEDE